MNDKILDAKKLIEYAIKNYDKLAVACSFGKDSIVVTDIARQVDPNILVFSIMTMYKPKETFEYLRRMREIMNLNLTIYYVGDSWPHNLSPDGIDVIFIPDQEFVESLEESLLRTSKPLYEVNPSECCRLLKVEPTRIAVQGLNAWICGLRNTEGTIRGDYEKIERRGGLVKINPILDFTEEEIWRYLQEKDLPIHPWYELIFEDGRKYRSLGCEPCTKPIRLEDSERAGRWQNTSKCGGECGIHTKNLK